MKIQPPTVYVVDDDPAVRNSVRMLLKAVGIAATPLESAAVFLTSVDRAQPGCVLLDVRMPGMNGLELQKKLKADDFRMPVIFMTGHGDVPMAVEAMHEGAFDFLQKPFRDQDIIDTVQAALAHDRQRRELLKGQEDVRQRLATLSPREREVLALMIQGKANKVMSGDLGISQRTVEIHRARVMEKMQARSLAQLVRMSIDSGAISEVA